MNKTARRQIKVTVQTKERPEETQRTGSMEDKVLENAMTVALQRFGLLPSETSTPAPPAPGRMKVPVAGLLRILSG